MQRAFQQVSATPAYLTHSTIWYKQGVNGIVIPNLYRQYALNQKADLSSSNSKKGCFLLHKTIYTSSIYIIHILQSTFGFSDWSGVTEVVLGSKRSVPFRYRTFLARKAQVHLKLPCPMSQLSENIPHIMLQSTVINDKADLLNAFWYYSFPTEAYLKYQWVTL